MFTAPTSSPLTERTRVRHTLHPVRREGNTSHARTTFPVRPASPSGTRPSDAPSRRSDPHPPFPEQRPPRAGGSKAPALQSGTPDGVTVSRTGLAFKSLIVKSSILNHASSFMVKFFYIKDTGP